MGSRVTSWFIHRCRFWCIIVPIPLVDDCLITDTYLQVILLREHLTKSSKFDLSHLCSLLEFIKSHSKVLLLVAILIKMFLVVLEHELNGLRGCALASQIIGLRAWSWEFMRTSSYHLASWKVWSLNCCWALECRWRPTRVCKRRVITFYLLMNNCDLFFKISNIGLIQIFSALDLRCQIRTCLLLIAWLINCWKLPMAFFLFLYLSRRYISTCMPKLIISENIFGLAYNHLLSSLVIDSRRCKLWNDLSLYHFVILVRQTHWSFLWWFFFHC